MKTSEYILEESMRYRATDLNSMSDTARIIRAMEEYHFQFKSQPSGKEPTEEAIKTILEKHISEVNEDYVVYDTTNAAKELFSLFASISGANVTDEVFKQFLKDSIKNKTYQKRFGIACDFPQDEVDLMIDEAVDEYLKSKLNK